MQIKLITEAVKLDEDAKLKEAAELYCEAMAFFLPAIECKLYIPNRVVSLKRERERERKSRYFIDF